jgi:hypothetical protein
VGHKLRRQHNGRVFCSDSARRARALPAYHCGEVIASRALPAYRCGEVIASQLTLKNECALH